MLQSGKFVLLLFLGIISTDLSAQDAGSGKQRLYDSWINAGNNTYPVKGLLFEIKDSSVILANSRFRPDLVKRNFKQIEIPYDNIEVLKVRHVNSIRRGMVIGGSALGGLMLGFGIAGKELMGDLAPLVITEVTILSVGAGAGIGALFGMLKDVIPVNGNFEAFNSNRSRMQKYSFANEYAVPGSTKRIEHKCYIGMMIGPSFPAGVLANKSPVDSLAGYAKTGNGGDYISLGYRIKNNWGFSAKYFDNQYNVSKPDSKEWWAFGGFMAGPMYTLPAGNRLFFDFKPRIGYVDSQYSFNDESYFQGHGFGIEIASSIQFNIANRWCLLAGGGYISSNQKYPGRIIRKMSCWDLSVGAGYRFK